MLLGLGLPACSKEGAPESSEASQTTITVHLTAKASPEDLSLLASAQTGLRHIDFDTSGSTPSISAPAGATFSSHAFFRKAGASFVGYGEIIWKSLGRDASGKILLEARNATVTLHNTSGVEPQPGEPWYVAAILGGGTLDATKTKVSFAYEQALDMAMQPNQIRVPLLSSWEPLEVIQEIDGAMRVASSADLHFKPQGVLYKVELTNKSGSNLTETKIRLETEASSTQGVFDFSLSANPETSITAGGYQSQFAHATAAGTIEYMERPIAPVANNDKVTALAWGMPFTSTATDNRHVGVFYPHRRVLKTSGQTNQWMRYFGPIVWSTSGASSINGKTVRITGDIERLLIPIEYFASSWNHIPAGNYNSVNMATAPVPLGYTLPTSHQDDGLFMLKFDGMSLFLAFSSGAYGSDVIDQTEGASGAFNMVFGSWRGINGVGYALRGAGTPYYSAWRGRWITDAASPVGKSFELTARYLDATPATGINDITNDAYWTQNNDKDISIRFIGASTTTPWGSPVVSTPIYWVFGDNGMFVSEESWIADGGMTVGPGGALLLRSSY